MTIEIFTLASAGFLSLASIFYIPKKQLRKALLAFLIFQASTWLISLLLVHSKEIVMNFREFPKATRVDFIPHFLLYPIIFTWFILLYPKDKSIWIKMIHYAIFISLPMLFIFFTSTFTNLRRPVSGTFYDNIVPNYLIFFCQFRLCQLYIDWFFKKKDL